MPMTVPLRADFSTLASNADDATGWDEADCTLPGLLSSSLPMDSGMLESDMIKL